MIKSKYVLRNIIVKIYIMQWLTLFCPYYVLLSYPTLKMRTLWKWSNKSNCFISLLSSEVSVMTSVS